MYKTPYSTSVYGQASHNVSPLKAVVMLYEGMIRLIREAKLADQEHRFEDRFKAVEKASRVLLGLQGQLDFENGGEISPILHEYYDSLFMRMMQINSRNGQSVADDVIAGLVEMKQSWEQVRDQSEQERHASMQKATTYGIDNVGDAEKNRAKIVI
ncbi:flagellar export chaperone FliS [Kiloniella laminariae]|uniref:Flagellar export chaperone FliS n=1 Tax=Kiloniella laminariae TaxID=454162 RepID=A0ABT4LHD4_9PROT|nr:flagellar export chaperone FliS [Kiloniella laminariae]MCZ4280511.1 flagellar export chaperone FliS [Kiloniella laminariae]